MSKVSTFIDITQGMLILESPNCEQKLEISIENRVSHSPREELDVYGQRCILILRHLTASHIFLFIRLNQIIFFSF